MNTKHTPTPWKYHETFTAGEPQGFVISAGALNICQLFTGDNQADEEADAAFIVRACNAHDEMVAALSDAYSHVTLLGSGQTPPLSNSEMCHLLGTALAKAKGE